ncbi:MAG: 3-oxoacyl-ACP reductase FabG [Methylococcaceae bacterium]|nr:3-oxoacyl-ACP reductase FabG [Methylococcaceae bacterium]
MEKQVLVTGSSRGIGKAIAERLAMDGYRIVVHGYHNCAAAAEVAEMIVSRGQSARVLCFDIADRGQCQSVLNADLAQHGPYYGVVCNAGIAMDNVFPALSGSDWDRVMRTNLDGFYNVLHPLVMPMIRAGKKGRIVTLSSVSGLLGNRGQVNYSAAKAGIIGASKALAVELAKRGITVNCVAPGLIESQLSKNLALDEAKKQIPARRLGKPEEVASLVGYLFSEDAAYITRQVISVNGGLF